MMKFVDRNVELGKLLKVLRKDSAQLVVLYGRRRIGKSTLVKKSFEEVPGIFFQADQTSVTNQLYLLARAVEEQVEGFSSAVYPDWESLLKALNRQLSGGVTLCLDEFPYLVKSSPSLPSVIQNFWDNGNPRFNLILCGSSQQSMYTELLNEQSPLYGRADLIMKLGPISIGYIGETMELRDACECVENYSLWGGVPRYWQLAKGYGGWRDAMGELMLQPDTTLTDEPNRLLRDEMREVVISRTILSTVGAGANKLGEIASRVGRPVTEMSASVKRLIDMGYLRKDVPFGENPKNSKKTLYEIADNFLDAYYNFCAPNASLIALGRTGAVWKVLEARLPVYFGRQWERICRDAVSGNMVDGICYGVARRWWGNVLCGSAAGTRQVEIDLLAESLDGTILLAGECKWTKCEDGARLLADLRAKVENLSFANKYKEIRYALFLRENCKSPSCRIFLPDEMVALSE